MSTPITAAVPGPELTDDQLLAAYAWNDGDGDGSADGGVLPARALFRFNFVTSVDGAATLQGRSGGLGDGADRRVFGLLRRTADVVLVGAGTVRAEGYAGELLDAAGQSWRAASGRPAHPGLAIVSGSLDLDPDSDLFREAPVRPLLLTSAAAPADRRAALAEVADVVTAGERTVEPERVARVLAGRGFRRVLGEGGPQLFGAFQAAGLVDELCLTVSPLLTAGAATRITAGTPETDPRRLELVHVLCGGNTLLLRYRSLGAG